MTTRIERLAPSILRDEALERYESMQNDSIKVLQVGEGNFLRGFFDWMIHECRKCGVYDGTIAVTSPRPSGSSHLKQLEASGGLYTVLTRGQAGGRIVEEHEVITAIRKFINPYEAWDEFLHLADNPDLEVVVSNTTEAGLFYESVPFTFDKPMASFPARLTVFLYRRFQSFAGASDKGLIILPCELVEANGDLLSSYVKRHARDWNLSPDFIAWLGNHNQFLNTLVDRIVTGYPKEDAPGLFQAWGYEDPLLTVAEPYYFWAIEGDEILEEKLPFQKAGLQVEWVRDLAAFRLRKVRILNGAHTMMAIMGLIRGFGHVRQVALDENLGRMIRAAVYDEMAASLSLDQNEVRLYADEVWERFCNPFIEHRLTAIAMNSISKFRVRLLPSVSDTLPKTGKLPSLITQCFAELIYLYKSSMATGTDGQIRYVSTATGLVLEDTPEVCRDFSEYWAKHDAGEVSLERFVEVVLSDRTLWDDDLSKVPGLAKVLEGHLAVLLASV